MTAQRKDIRFASGFDLCAGWFYSASKAKQPLIIVAHGIGAIKEMGLHEIATSFHSKLDVNVLVFDYRFLGASTGKPRQLVDVPKQLEDWKAALDFAETELAEQIDTDRIAIFGTSFGGGHVITVAAREPKRVKAVISQCPFTSGFHSAQTTGVIPALWLTAAAVRDMLFSKGDDIVKVPLAGKPGEVACMNAHDVWDGYLGLAPSGIEVHNYIAARLVLQLPFIAPGKDAKRVKCPIFFAICGRDTVAPPSPSLSYAKQAPKGVVRLYEDMGHFDIYRGAAFDRAHAEYIEFYREHLKL